MYVIDFICEMRRVFNQSFILLLHKSMFACYVGPPPFLDQPTTRCLYHVTFMISVAIHVRGMIHNSVDFSHENDIFYRRILKL